MRLALAIGPYGVSALRLVGLGNSRVQEAVQLMILETLFVKERPTKNETAVSQIAQVRNPSVIIL